MKKVILHGGYSNKDNVKNDIFYKEILNSFNEDSELNVLLVLFAKEEESYDVLFKVVSHNFEKNSGNRKLTFVIADRDNFIKQVQNSDVIYLSGGQTLKLIDILKSYPEFITSLDTKVIVGDSAGAYALSSCFYSKTEGGLFNGLGLAPVKVICHYEGENSEKFDEYSSELETLLLKDYEFKVFKN